MTMGAKAKRRCRILLSRNSEDPVGGLPRATWHEALSGLEKSRAASAPWRETKTVSAKAKRRCRILLSRNSEDPVGGFLGQRGTKPFGAWKKVERQCPPLQVIRAGRLARAEEGLSDAQAYDVPESGPRPPARTWRRGIARYSFFLFDQSVMAVTDSLSVPPYPSKKDRSGARRGHMAP